MLLQVHQEKVKTSKKLQIIYMKERAGKSDEYHRCQRHQKEVVFAKPDEYFPDEMICAHFSNHKWGPNPNKPK